MVFLNYAQFCQGKKLMDPEKIDTLKPPSGACSCLRALSGRVFGGVKADPEEKEAREMTESSRGPEE